MIDTWESPAWMAQGACIRAPVNLWASTAPDRVDLAKAVCAGCPVRAECLAYAVAYRMSDDVWGGLTPAERGASKRMVPRTKTA